MKIIHAPNPLEFTDKVKIFLAGSIENGKAENWQTRVSIELMGVDCILLNPRRPDWDDSWEQKITNPKFKEQVTWELYMLERSDIVAMYFSPGTLSPISLLEFGLFANPADLNKRLVVYCPEGFWRKGNIDIVCERYKIKNCKNWDDFIANIGDAYTKIILT
jgi:hypothetical protein